MSSSWSDLVNQQFWLFGRDIVSPQGNRLIHLGGERLAEWRRGKAAVYQMPVVDDAEASIILWGFGALYVSNGTAQAYLQRATGFLRKPTSEQAAIDWERAKAESFLRWPITRDSCDDGMQLIARWIANHERTIQQRYGVGAREQDLAEWAEMGKPVTSVERIVPSWDSYAWPDICNEAAQQQTPYNTYRRSKFRVQSV